MDGIDSECESLCLLWYYNLQQLSERKQKHEGS